MVKLEIKYESEEEKANIIKILSARATVKQRGKVYKKGKYYRVYLDIE